MYVYMQVFSLLPPSLFCFLNFLYLLVCCFELITFLFVFADGAVRRLEKLSVLEEQRKRERGKSLPIWLGKEKFLSERRAER